MNRFFILREISFLHLVILQIGHADNNKHSDCYGLDHLTIHVHICLTMHNVKVNMYAYIAFIWSIPSFHKNLFANINVNMLVNLFV